MEVSEGLVLGKTEGGKETEKTALLFLSNYRLRGAETLWWEIVRWSALRLGSSSNTRLTLCVPIRLLPHQAPSHFCKGGPVGSLRGRISVPAYILSLSSSYHLLRLISQNKLSGPSVCQSICVVDLQWYDAVDHLELCILSPIIEPHLKMLWMPGTQCWLPLSSNYIEIIPHTNIMFSSCHYCLAFKVLFFIFLPSLRSLVRIMLYTTLEFTNI